MLNLFLSAGEPTTGNVPSRWMPPYSSSGLGIDLLRLATVITPDVAEETRAIFLQTLIAAVDEKNAASSDRQRAASEPRELQAAAERRWDLDIWELKGAPDTWGEQLHAWQRKTPVFALLSGLGDGAWEPVQQFCETLQLPCWFPSLLAPPADADTAAYSLYFSQGTRLEARVLAQALRARLAAGGALTQLVGAGYAASAGALELAAALPATVRAVSQAFAGTGEMRACLESMRAEDALVLWLAPNELAALAQLPPPLAAGFASSVLVHAQLEHLPASWRGALQWVHLYELPLRRTGGTATLHSWIGSHGLPLADDVLQSEVLFATQYLRYTLAAMHDKVSRNRLIKSGERLLRADSVIGYSATMYPRLQLAPGEHCAVRGAYLVRSADGAPGHPAPDHGWVAARMIES